MNLSRRSFLSALAGVVTAVFAGAGLVRKAVTKTRIPYLTDQGHFSSVYLYDNEYFVFGDGMRISRQQLENDLPPSLLLDDHLTKIFWEHYENMPTQYESLINCSYVGGELKPLKLGWWRRLWS